MVASSGIGQQRRAPDDPNRQPDQEGQCTNYLAHEMSPCAIQQYVYLRNFFLIIPDSGGNRQPHWFGLRAASMSRKRGVGARRQGSRVYRVRPEIVEHDPDRLAVAARVEVV
jgi:hypothetical protein